MVIDERGPRFQPPPLSWWPMTGFAGAFLLSCFFASAVEAQHVLIPDRGVCPTCTIDLDHVVTLRTAAGPGALVGSPKVVVVDSRNHYYVVDWRDRTHVMEFGPDGSFVRDIGREGDGPGEFRRIEWLAVGPSDTVFVFDRSRLSVMDSTGTMARSIRFGGRVYDAQVTDSTIIVSARVATREHVGIPFHDLSIGDGEMIRSFGIDQTFRPDRMDWGAGVLAQDDAGRLLTAMRSQYVLDIWSTSRQHVQRFVRESDWFPAEILPDAMATRDSPRPPLITGLLVDDGLAVVVINVSHEDWVNVIPEPIVVNGQRVLPIQDGQGVFQTRLEVIDVDRGVLLTSQRFDVEAFGVVGDGLVYAPRQTEMGAYHTDILRITVSPVR